MLLSDREPNVQSLKDLEQCIDTWVAFAGERPVQGLPSQSASFSDRGHAFGARDVPKGLSEIFGIVFRQRHVEVFDQRFIGVEEIDHIEFLELHHASSEFTCHLLGSAYVSLLARLIPTAEQDYYLVLTNSVVSSIAPPDIYTEFANPTAHRPVITEISIFDALNSGCNRGFGQLITQVLEPFFEDLSVNDLHGYIVSYKGQIVNRAKAKQHVEVWLDSRQYVSSKKTAAAAGDPVLAEGWLRSRRARGLSQAESKNE